MKRLWRLVFATLALGLVVLPVALVAGTENGGAATGAAVSAPVPSQPVPTGPTPPPAPVAIEKLANGDLRMGAVTLHRASRTLSFPASLTETTYQDVYEVLIATGQGRLHESLLRTDAAPLHLQTMLLLLGANNGPRLADAKGHRGDLVDLDIEYTDATGKVVCRPVENWLWDQQADKLAARVGWVFVGTDIQNGTPLADAEGNLVVTYSVGSTILDTPDPQSREKSVLGWNPEQKEPGKGAAVRVILTPRRVAPPVPGTTASGK